MVRKNVGDQQKGMVIFLSLRGRFYFNQERP